MNDIVKINLRLNDLTMINENILSETNYEPGLDKNGMIDMLLYEFRNATTELKDS